MVRPFRRRRVSFSPEVNYFKPAGVPLKELKEETLKMEELEALRLCDVDGLKQEEAANKMNVSQPTLFRVLSNARKKMAQALIEGKSIRIEGGNYEMIQTRGRRRGSGRGLGFGGPGMNCVCPKCGYAQVKQAGTPCLSLRCPECGAQMIRGD
ncbi:MAG: DUF134 domain-containing protein [Nanoarchaeota archaeon]|nr:DUF134 domain-containing protein [Nanoarchaeota archaeon]